MPLTLSNNYISKKNLLNQSGAFLTLLKFTYDTDIVRIVHNTENVTWDGQTWYAYPLIKIGDVTESKEGEIPSISMTVVDLGRNFIPVIEENDGAVDAEVDFYQVHSDLLAESEALHLTYSVMSTRVKSGYVCEFKLGSENLLNYRFPQDRYMKNFCRFQLGDTNCKYSGAETDCDGTFARCIELSNSANYGGFPGIPVGGVYV